GRPDTDSPLSNRATFEMMVRSDLVDGDNMIKLCCGAEIDALRGGSNYEPIELKTAWEGFKSGIVGNVRNVMRSELVGVRSIVTGIKRGDIKNNDVVVHKVVEQKVADIKLDKHISEKIRQCYSFLFDFLSRLKKFLVGHEACEVAFDPFLGEVTFKSISRQEANSNGNGDTDEFLTRFNI
ncbi:hypothetical protein PMAYCL1PPCAC_24898, partial [Pristionchus mayeri]